ncbi:hypothetical protein [Pedobacter agri]|uniref:hypothetical protein n=1 Tax=Pedobacter agri TaxID=454586 RepID=UPI00277F6C42|nr:hypothetical protein [Pedobacter agri]MDQ1142360.1 hypothetical protein [Pedobacter agri]
MAAIFFITFIFFLLYQKAEKSRTNDNVEDYKKFRANLWILAIAFVFGSGLLVYLQLVLFK